MVNHERAKVVRAMDTIAHCINNEYIMDSWLMSGVADGDITTDTTDEDLEGYCNDDTFRELMSLFLRCMFRASASGGLCVDWVVSETRHISWS